MDALRFDSVAKALAQRKLTRRNAIVKGSTGIAVGALSASGLASIAKANDATPAADEGDAKVEYLFVQTYQSGTIAPKDGSEDRYTLTLDAGTGQTIYFSDRPNRIVGANATSEFLEGLGFPDDNPPNAALVLETHSGETDIAVVELFAPVFDESTNGVTYEIEVLANWESSLEMGFSEAPVDLGAIAPEFGGASLFIDDCANRGIICYSGDNAVGEFMSQDFCYWWSYAGCYPCENGGAENRDQIAEYWHHKCNETYEACNGECKIGYAGPVICTDPRGCN
jgi:hypothetical protein